MKLQIWLWDSHFFMELHTCPIFSWGYVQCAFAALQCFGTMYLNAAVIAASLARVMVRIRITSNRWWSYMCVYIYTYIHIFLQNTEIGPCRPCIRWPSNRKTTSVTANFRSRLLLLSEFRIESPGSDNSHPWGPKTVYRISPEKSPDSQDLWRCWGISRSLLLSMRSECIFNRRGSGTRHATPGTTTTIIIAAIFLGNRDRTGVPHSTHENWPVYPSLSPSGRTPKEGKPGGGWVGKRRMHSRGGG